MTILQHGRTPLQDLNPSLTIVNGDARQTFHAKETKEPGVYRVSVTFPSSGLWRYEVNDGFITGQPHTFKAIQVGAPGTPPAAANTSTTAAADDGGPSLLWLSPAWHCSLPRRRPAVRAPAAPPPIRRRRESHHPRRRWPRLRGGGDDDRRLRRRRLGRPRSRRPRRAAVATSAPAAGPDRGQQVFLEQGCGSCHAFEPAGTSGPIGPDLALSLHGKSRDYVLESIVLPERERGRRVHDRRDARRLRRADRPRGPRPAGRVPDARSRVEHVRVFDHVDIRVSDFDASDALLRHRPRRARQAAHGHGGRVRGVGRLLDPRRRAARDAAPARGLLRPARARRRLPPRRRRGRLHQRRRARARGRQYYARVLRRLPPGPGRQQRRGRLRRRASASSARSTICGCGSPTSPPPRASTRRSRPHAGFEVAPPRPRAHPARRPRRLLLAHRGRADRERPHRLPRRQRRRRRLPRTPPSRPATGTTARPASARTITPATTAPSCSTPTATTSRSSITTAEAAPAPRRSPGR